MCGINASGIQWFGHISRSCSTHLKLELLLHKTVLVMFLLASTVLIFNPIDNLVFSFACTTRVGAFTPEYI